MCGILGLFSPRTLDGCAGALQRANDVVAYRGPDGAGFALFPATGPDAQAAIRLDRVDGADLSRITLALGHRRLAILDLSPAGRQPMANASGTIWITHNGEIFNYLELRAELEREGRTFRSDSDTEVILQAYEAWGEECVHRFNGMWAFVLVDLPRQKLFGSRDRLGVKPLHYYNDGEHFAFASEIKQLLCLPFVSRQIDERAVYEFLAYGAVEYSPSSFFRGVQKLRHGHNLSLYLGTGQMDVRAYYDPPLQMNSTLSLADAAAELKRLLADSVRLRLRSDVPVGSCLSGGLDSSSIVCLIHEQLASAGHSHVQRTFSAHFEDPEANEFEYMQEVVRSTGVQAAFIQPTPEDLQQDLERLIWHQEEPFGSTSLFAQWCVFRLAREHGVTVMLDGQGADELLAGYVGLWPTFFAELRAKRQYVRLGMERLQHAWAQSGSVTALLGSLVRPRSASLPPPDCIRPELSRRFEQQALFPATQELAPFGPAEQLNNRLYQMTFHNNLQSLLKYEDRSSMAFSIEARVPFLDYRLVEFLLTLPSTLKIHGGYTKRVLREGMRGILPEKIRWRVGKLGFATPERRWQTSVLRPRIEAAVRSTAAAPFLVPERALAYLERIDREPILDFAPWRWLSLERWMHAYGLA